MMTLLVWAWSRSTEDHFRAQIYANESLPILSTLRHDLLSNSKSLLQLCPPDMLAHQVSKHVVKSHPVSCLCMNSRSFSRLLWQFGIWLFCIQYVPCLVSFCLEVVLWRFEPITFYIGSLRVKLILANQTGPEHAPQVERNC